MPFHYSHQLNASSPGWYNCWHSKSVVDAQIHLLLIKTVKLSNVD